MQPYCINISFRADNTILEAPVAFEGERLKKGDVVTFSYKSYSSNSIPVDPKVIRIRKDLEWRDVMRSHAQELTMNGIDNLNVVY